MDIENDDFDAAWDEATTGPNPDPTPSDDLEEPPEPEQTDPPAEEPPAPDEPSAPEDLQARYDELQQAYRTLDGRYRVDRERWAGQQGQSPTSQQPTPQAPDEDEQFLDKFRKEYNDDVLRAIDIVSRRRAGELVTQQLSRFAPVEQSVETVLEQLHFQTIESVHPDVQEINESPAFDAWIDSRPVHLRGAYQHVREHGSPQEVISLLNEYKEFNQPKSPSSVPEAKIHSAAAVKNRRGALPTKAGPDMDDFDAAWEEATRLTR